MLNWLKSGHVPEPRKGMPSPRLEEREFKERFRAQFRDQEYDALAVELDRITQAAWDAYEHSRKSPRTRKAGPGFADPEYELGIDWIAAHEGLLFPSSTPRKTGKRPKKALRRQNSPS